MKKGQMVKVSSFAPHHANRIGYFQFYGKGPSEGVVVLADKPDKNPRVLFAVDVRFINFI